MVVVVGMSDRAPTPARGWHPYDAAALTALGAPPDAIAALTDPGLPRYAIFTRSAERELKTADLPGCGRCAYLAQAYDGFNNTYWLRIADGSIWMRYGVWDAAPHHTLRVNTSVAGLQGVLHAWCDFEAAEVDEADEQAYEDAVIQTTIRAVAADPEAFTEENAWWALTFEELEYTIARIPAGGKAFHRLVRQNESGGWILDHPGYED